MQPKLKPLKQDIYANKVVGVCPNCGSPLYGHWQMSGREGEIIPFIRCHSCGYSEAEV